MTNDNNSMGPNDGPKSPYCPTHNFPILGRQIGMSNCAPYDLPLKGGRLVAINTSLGGALEARTVKGMVPMMEFGIELLDAFNKGIMPCDYRESQSC